MCVCVHVCVCVCVCDQVLEDVRNSNFPPKFESSLPVEVSRCLVNGVW